MSAHMLSGRELATAMRTQAGEGAAKLADRGVTVQLAVVVATREESAWWYVRSLEKAGTNLDIACRVVDLGPEASAESLAAPLGELSADGGVHGIILQAPLPPGARLPQLALQIDPDKDVDGASPVSLGRLTVGLPAFAPATAQAVLRLLDFHGIELSGQRAVVVGRSAVVGKPVAQLLLARDATVTICHSRTRDLAEVTSAADLLVVAAGRAGLITAQHVRPGAVVIDVGTNPTADGRLTGDVDADGVATTAGALSPVPGGVGPVTTAQLLLNTVTTASGRSGG